MKKYRKWWKYAGVGTGISILLSLGVTGCGTSPTQNAQKFFSAYDPLEAREVLSMQGVLYALKAWQIEGYPNDSMLVSFDTALQQDENNLSVIQFNHSQSDVDAFYNQATEVFTKSANDVNKLEQSTNAIQGMTLSVPVAADATQLLSLLKKGQQLEAKYGIKSASIPSISKQ